MSKPDIGRFGENIVTNDLLERGFLVTHLDKGTRGVSTNADLLVGHEKLTKPILIQVRACYANKLQRAFFGGIPKGFFDDKEKLLFNAHPGFIADFIISVSIKTPKDYRVFVLPVKLAERQLAAGFRKWHRVVLKSGGERKPVPTMYLQTLPKSEWKRFKANTKQCFTPAWNTVIAHENAYSLLLNSSTKRADLPSCLGMDLSPDKTPLVE